MRFGRLYRSGEGERLVVGRYGMRCLRSLARRLKRSQNCLGAAPSNVSALRKALDDGAGDQGHIVTVPGRGYHLIGLVDTPAHDRDRPSIMERFLEGMRKAGLDEFHSGN